MNENRALVGLMRSPPLDLIRVHPRSSAAEIGLIRVHLRPIRFAFPRPYHAVRVTAHRRNSGVIVLLPPATNS